MARVHSDLHVISVEHHSKLMKFLLDNAMICSSVRDVRPCDISYFERTAPDECLILKVKSVY